MIKNSIFYYTNNVVPKGILEKTLSNCISFVENNEDTELIITSHLPLTKKYKDVSSKFNVFLDERLNDVATSLCIDVDNPRVFPYVVGELPHCIGSIIDQIMFSLECAKGENIIMMEHDVFYPLDYFEEVVSELDKGYDFVFVKNHLFLCGDGFFNVSNFYPLSRFSGKKSAWIDLYTHIVDKKLIEVEPSLKGIGTVDRGLNDVENFLIFENKNPVLDISHGLNTSGRLLDYNYYDNDEYWGHKDSILSLIDDEYARFVNYNPMFRYGLHAVS
jgi:hypothetical protein